MTEAHLHLATRHIRMLLVKAGLTEQEADAFIDRLRSEFMTGTTLNEASRQILVDSFLAALETRNGKRNLDGIKSAIAALLIGLAGNALYDMLKAEFLSIGEITTHGTIDAPGHPPMEGPLGAWKGELLIDWGFTPRLPAFAQAEGSFRRALEIRESRLGRSDRLIAVSNDALGMCLDGLGRHREAVGYHATALRIAKRASGPKHPDTAAAMSNLGLCLIACREISDGEALLRHGFELMRRRFGLQHVWTAAALFNWYYGLRRQGRFLQAHLQPQVNAAERPIQTACQQMMAQKTVIVTIDAVKVILEELKKMLTSLPQQ